MKQTKLRSSLGKSVGALVMILSLSFVGCSQKEAEGTNSKQVEPSAEVVKSIKVEATLAPEAEKSATRIFTDSCGREVEIPTTIQKVAPSGSLAQIVLYSVAPDKLIGLSSEFSEVAKPYVDEKYYNLPTFGQFYGKNVSLNMEALAAAAPDIIIDIGQAKESIKEDMDGIQEQVGIPVIFVEATLETMDQAYLTLGELLGEEEYAQKLSDYTKSTIEDAKTKSASIKEEDRVKVYYGEGDQGLNTNGIGSIHADVLELVGGINVADLSQMSGTGGEEVSMEQVMLWEPDVLLFGPNSIYKTVLSDSLWADLKAVKDGYVYEVPLGPYNWMGRPPSVNRLIGIKWLGQLLYPDVYQYDLIKETKNFYNLFYHYELSDEEAKALMNNSLYK